MLYSFVGSPSPKQNMCYYCYVLMLILLLIVITGGNNTNIQCKAWLGSVVVGRRTVGLVIERSRVRLPAGALPGNLGQLSLPSLRGR